MRDSILRHILALLSALLLSVQHVRSLKIKTSEVYRYFFKSSALALCYAGFSEARSFRQAWRSGKAGFLCCAYDVVTDWRSFDPESRRVFWMILSSVTSDERILSSTMDLYDRDASGRILYDGLERGAIALRLILAMMRCESSREQSWGDLDSLGYRLQIVDDVLDYEHDLCCGETNCLRAELRWFYLDDLIANLDELTIKRLFGQSLMNLAICRAVSKACEMRESRILSHNSRQPSGSFQELSPHS